MHANLLYSKTNNHTFDSVFTNVMVEEIVVVQTIEISNI